MENVKVIIWGLGAMGGGMADMILQKKGIEIVGVAGRGAKIGKSMYDYIKTERGDRPDVIIQSEEDVIKPGAADVVLLCTDSFTKNAFPRMKFILEQGINVITSAEEMADSSCVLVSEVTLSSAEETAEELSAVPVAASSGCTMVSTITIESTKTRKFLTAFFITFSLSVSYNRGIPPDCIQIIIPP